MLILGPVAGSMLVWSIVIVLSIMAPSRGFRPDELLPSTLTPTSVFYFFNPLLHLANIFAVAVAIVFVIAIAGIRSLSLSRRVRLGLGFRGFVICGCEEGEQRRGQGLRGVKRVMPRK